MAKWMNRSHYFSLIKWFVMFDENFISISSIWEREMWVSVISAPLTSPIFLLASKPNYDGVSVWILLTMLI